MNIPNEQAITSVKDLEAVLAGAYDGLQSGNVLGGNMVVYADLLADDVKVEESRLNYFGTYEIYNRRTTVQINALRGMWSDAYSTINRANNIIHVIDNNLLSGTEFDTKKSKLKGEALFIRAIVHFELVRFWAQAYDILMQGANTQMGIPYRTAPTLSGFDNLAMARHTVEEVYTKAINDLTEAESLLPDDRYLTKRGRANKMSAVAYLARVHLSKGDYANAKFYSQKIVDANNTGINGYGLNSDLQAVFKTSGSDNTSECIFQLINVSTDQSNPIVYSYNPSDNTLPLFKGSSAISKLYVKLNAVSFKDQRGSKYVSIYPAGDVLFNKKYLNSNPAYNVVVLRSAEQYLINAEASLMLGDTTQALFSYKKLKARAFGSYWADETNIVSLSDSIKIERRRELICEGDRYHTLKRLKQDLKPGVPWNDPASLFKIPQEEMSGNPLMIQNP